MSQMLCGSPADSGILSLVTSAEGAPLILLAAPGRAWWPGWDAALGT